ncbi:MAG TPA: transglycosylase domain-containing protein, partial [Candidatus Eisenbacteria bacterium]|nr:transglycosylase domain-containing protein [Candidatus Eisenbacteria bacterium]
LLYAIYATQDRTVVPLQDIPNYLKQATIAIEDKNFYKNPGFDIGAILRAFLADVSHKNFQGGSTLTQQLVKSTLLTPEQSIKRKVEEILISFWTEHMYSKDEILQLYLNEVPYGGTAWGVESAANLYFGKSVKDLDLAESAFLAGLPQAPTTYSPFGIYPNLWKNRQVDVLSHMKDLGFITSKQEEEAKKEELEFAQPQTPLHAPHFAMYIKDLLIQKYGLPLVEKGGLNVVTTLDLPIQEYAQQVVTTEVGKDSSLALTNGAAVVTNPKTGDILAMVGSADYNNPNWGNVNIATSLRQPGSSIKVVTYAAGLSRGMTAATPIDDSPVSFPGLISPYAPVNYDGQFHGRVTLRQALANSFNIPAVKTLNNVGIDAFVDLGHALGISHLGNADEYGLSVTLGSAEVTMLDMATAYGTLANLGQRVDINPILKITDSNGTVLEEKKSASGEQVLDKGVAFILGDILADNTARSWEFGSNSPLKIDNHFVSVKTGTTDNKRDNWTDGYTPNFVVITWVGNNDNTPMSQSLASGITGAAPIWHGIMSKLLDKTTDQDRIIPDDIISKECLGHTEYFVKGTEDSINCAMSIPTWTPTPSPTP